MGWTFGMPCLEICRRWTELQKRLDFFLGRSAGEGRKASEFGIDTDTFGKPRTYLFQRVLWALSISSEVGSVKAEGWNTFWCISIERGDPDTTRAETDMTVGCTVGHLSNERYPMCTSMEVNV